MIVVLDARRAGALFGSGLSEHAAVEAEIAQGKAAIDASVRAGVEFFVASLLEVRYTARR